MLLYYLLTAMKKRVRKLRKSAGSFREMRIKFPWSTNACFPTPYDIKVSQREEKIRPVSWMRKGGRGEGGGGGGSLTMKAREFQVGWENGEGWFSMEDLLIFRTKTSVFPLTWYIFTAEAYYVYSAPPPLLHFYFGPFAIPKSEFMFF